MATKGKVVIIGAGRSGRGYLAELCYLEGYEITLADYNHKLIDDLNEKSRYHSFRQNDQGDGFLDITIDGYTAVQVHSDRERYLVKLSEADLIFTATFDDAFESIITDIKESLALRIQRGYQKPFAFLLGANYIGLNDYFEKAISRELGNAAGNCRNRHSKFKRFRRTFLYGLLRISPQAILFPESPAGCVVKSSRLEWMITERPIISWVRNRLS